jgi:hypothetical protein
MTSWDDFVVRRGINFEDFKQKYEINTEADLVECCRRFGVEPPSQLKLVSLFPVQESFVQEKVEEPMPVQVSRQNKKSKSKE